MNNLLPGGPETTGEMVASVRESSQDDLGWQTLLERVYGVNGTDRRVFALVADADEPMTATEVAARIDRHRSTASRSLTRLRDAGLLRQAKRDDGARSYSYVYELRDADALADEMQRLLTAWHVRMTARAREFERQYERQASRPG